jgi:hypothetical protein
MHFYTQQHQYYCGIDLHTKYMYVCIIDQQANILIHKNIPRNPDILFKVLHPYLGNLALAVECMFT